MLSSDAGCFGRGDMSGEIMLAIRAARLFDGVGPDLVQRPVILVDEGSIIAVESGAVPARASLRWCTGSGTGGPLTGIRW